MKKNLLFLAFTLFVSLFTSAKDIDSITAFNVAKKFYTENATIKKSVNKENIELTLAYTCKIEDTTGISKLTNENLYYIFNINTNDGFVIVASDDIVSPIIGYSNEGNFTGKNLPPDFQWWVDGYKKQILFAKENNLQASDEIKLKWNELINNTSKNKSKNSKSSSVSPLTHTTWNQSPYYNALCPGGSVTGCVATAMAQIMKYWNFPPNGIGSHTYTDPTYGVQSVNFYTTTYKWSSMPNLSSSNAVATLMYDCGVSVDMNYSPSGSGAWVISAQSPVTNCSEYAFKTYFGYDTSTVQGLEYSNYTYQAFLIILKNELDNSRPVQYAGWDTASGDGHSWVCDGYDINDFFHMNWGWGGYCNSYFDINAMNPATYAFNSNEEVIIGIQPEAIPPTADFSANYSVSSCSGIVQFNDLSSHFPTSWIWDFGDGTTDTVRNPIHTYTTSGTYTVKLIESNNHGVDSLIKTNCVSVNVIPTPVASNATLCHSGNTTLVASGSGILNWYNSSTSGTIINTGTTFATPVLNSSTTYYVESEITSSPVYVAKPNNSGGGGYNISASNYLIFDCYSSLTIISVDVYANSTGVRAIQLRDSSGTVLQSTNVTLNTTGLNTVTLNFQVPVEANLQLGLASGSTADLYRNNAGVTFPYLSTGLLSVTGSSAGSSRYYFFYNWQIVSSSCTSARTPVIVHVLQNPVASFNYSSVSNLFTFNNYSTNAQSYLWDFGDGNTSAQIHPSHSYASNGQYTVKLTATNNCGQNVATQNITVIATGIGSLAADNFFEIFPNPSNGIFDLKFLSDDFKEIQINIFNIQGKKIYSDNNISCKKGISKNINLSNFEKGVYHLELITKSQIKNKIIIIQ